MIAKVCTQVSHLRFWLLCNILQCNIYWDTHISIHLCELWSFAWVLPLKMLFYGFEFHLYFWQMCKLFANKLYSINTYFQSPVWIMMVYNIFDAQNLLFICLQISPQIFAILQNFPINNLRDQQFCTLLCELERVVVVLYTGNTLEVEVLPGMVWLNAGLTCPGSVSKPPPRPGCPWWRWCRSSCSSPTPSPRPSHPPGSGISRELTVKLIVSQ